MNKFRLKQKVKITTSQKTDGRYNFGNIVGIELLSNDYYLGYKNEKEFLNRFKFARYKVAYIDCFTERAEVDWFMEDSLERK